MVLVVDAGNTSTSFALFCARDLIDIWSIQTIASRSSDQYASVLRPLLSRMDRLKKDGAMVAVLCSVVPSVDFEISTFCERYLGVKPLKISSKLELSFGLDVEEPTEVGADRLANAAYAVANLRLPAVVVDLGTATTFDVVTAGPVYRGGMILAGIQLGIDALSSKTAKLPMVDLSYPKNLIGRTTVECIQSGVLYGCLDAIEGLLNRIEQDLGESIQVAITGGYAPVLTPHLRREVALVPHLTLEGSLLLFEKEVQK